MSLVEMLATLLIMSFVAAAITEIAVTQNVVAFRTSNKIDALINARRVASSIERDVHNAKFIGNIFGPQTDQFSGTSNYVLNAQTLIVQTPVFYDPNSNGGYPAVPTQSRNHPGHWNVDTVVYQVVGDTTRPGTGQFVLQKSVFPGDFVAGSVQANQMTGQTILTGLVGPMSLTSAPDPVAAVPPPKVFGYMSKTIPLYSPLYVAGAQPDPTDIEGVSINLEITCGGASQRTDLNPRSLAFRTEMYMRGNYASPANYYYYQQ